MPLGIQQNNHLQRITLDVWQDQVFLNEKAYPAGYFAAEILNQKESTLQSLIQFGGNISYEAEALMRADRDSFARLLPQVRADASALLDALWTYPPYCFLDRTREQEVLDKFFRESMVGIPRLRIGSFSSAPDRRVCHPTWDIPFRGGWRLL